MIEPMVPIAIPLIVNPSDKSFPTYEKKSRNFAIANDKQDKDY